MLKTILVDIATGRPKAVLTGPCAPGDGEVLLNAPAGVDDWVLLAEYGLQGDTLAHIGAPTPTMAQQVAAGTAALERHYDAVARSRRYDDRYTCALRAGYPGPFQAEGLAFAQWMDACNAQGYAIMEACLAGTRPVPTEGELLAEMPLIAWP